MSAVSDAVWWECLLLAVQGSTVSEGCIRRFAVCLDAVLAERRSGEVRRG